MAQDDVQKYLDHAQYGTPKLKPDEQRKYLGTFRERCCTTMTVQQMAEKRNQQNFVKELEKYPNAAVLMNGAVDASLQGVFIRLSQQQGTPFTVVNDNVSDQPETIGLVLAEKEAVNEPVVDIEEKYPPAEEEPPAEKQSFWKKLF